MICLTCRVDVKGARCPKCNSSLHHVERLTSLLSGLDRGLDQRTQMAPCTIEEDYGGYYKVVDQLTNEAVMCGLDNQDCAFSWAMANGRLPVKNDQDVLKILNLISLSEK